MAQPNASGEHSARSLAEILREHGMETEAGTRPGRRTPFGARREGATGAHTAERPAVQADRGDRADRADRVERARRDEPAARVEPARSAPEPRSAPGPEDLARMLREHGLESEYGTRPGRPQPPQGARRQAAPRPAARAEAASPAAPPAAEPSVDDRRVTDRRTADRRSAETPADDRRTPERRTGDRRTTERRGPERPAAELFSTTPPAVPAAPATSSIPAVQPERSEPTGRTEERAERTGTVGDRSQHPATGRIPAAGRSAGESSGEHRAQRAKAPAADEEPLAGREGALAWARFAGEMVVALAGGVGVYFAFTALWQLMPYLAVVAAPLTVTVLVTGAQVWRQRQGEGALGIKLLAVLLFAGTVLVVAPAAGLLSG